MRRGKRIALLLGICGAAAVAVFAFPRIPQNPAYHDFADQRTIAGIPNSLNVLSNIPFAVIGVLGLWLIGSGRARFADSRERVIYSVFFLAVAATGIGSSYYHLAPDTPRLLWDRLPMSVGFMSLLAAMIAERISVRAGWRLFWPLVIAGIASLVWWRWTEQAARGDLRPYGLVQFDGLLAVLLLLALFPPRYTRQDLLWWMAGLYGAAKILEAADRAVWALGQAVSGHTIKHLAAASATACVAGFVARRHFLETNADMARSERAATALASEAPRS